MIDRNEGPNLCCKTDVFTDLNHEEADSAAFLSFVSPSIFETPANKAS